MKKYSINKEITIHAAPEAVWKVLTEPEIIKKYLYGTEAVSDWKEGSTLVFQGEYEGFKYKDKGVIQKWQPYSVFQYTYLSQYGGQEDKQENYHIITYSLTDLNGSTQLIVSQENIHTKQAQEHTDGSWDESLNQIKALAEELS